MECLKSAWHWCAAINASHYLTQKGSQTGLSERVAQCAVTYLLSVVAPSALAAMTKFVEQNDENTESMPIQPSDERKKAGQHLRRRIRYPFLSIPATLSYIPMLILTVRAPSVWEGVSYCHFRHNNPDGSWNLFLTALVEGPQLAPVDVIGFLSIPLCLASIWERLKLGSMSRTFVKEGKIDEGFARRNPRSDCNARSCVLSPSIPGIVRFLGSFFYSTSGFQHLNTDPQNLRKESTPECRAYRSAWQRLKSRLSLCYSLSPLLLLTVINGIGRTILSALQIPDGICRSGNRSYWGPDYPLARDQWEPLFDASRTYVILCGVYTGLVLALEISGRALIARSVDECVVLQQAARNGAETPELPL